MAEVRYNSEFINKNRAFGDWDILTDSVNRESFHMIKKLYPDDNFT